MTPPKVPVRLERTQNDNVTVDADDTNEALRLRVKHDAANNVIFSATIWATETRI